MTIPLSSPNAEIVIKKIDSTANNVYVQASGSETIDGSSAVTITTQYEAIKIATDGGGSWYIL